MESNIFFKFTKSNVLFQRIKSILTSFDMFSIMLQAFIGSCLHSSYRTNNNFMILFQQSNFCDYSFSKLKNILRGCFVYLPL